MRVLRTERTVHHLESTFTRFRPSRVQILIRVCRFKTHSQVVVSHLIWRLERVTPVILLVGEGLELVHGGDGLFQNGLDFLGHYLKIV